MVSSALAAANAELRLSGSDEKWSKLGVQVVGTFTATFVAEGSNDGGTTWVAIGMLPWAGGAAVASATAAGGWWVPTDGMALVRIRVSAYTSGTLNVYALPVVSG
jgi:hypothetical protein